MDTTPTNSPSNNPAEDPLEPSPKTDVTQTDKSPIQTSKELLQLLQEWIDKNQLSNLSSLPERKYPKYTSDYLDIDHLYDIKPKRVSNII